MNFRQFLELNFLQWQKEQGGRKNVSQFADYLGVSQSAVSSWWNNKRTPQGENVRKLADKLGIEVYDVLDLPRPNARLLLIEKLWEYLTPEQQDDFVKQAETNAEQNELHRSRTDPKRQTDRA